MRLLELLQPAADLGRLAAVVVDGRIAHPLLGLAVGALEVVDQVVERRAHGVKDTAAYFRTISGKAMDALFPARSVAETRTE